MNVAVAISAGVGAVVSVVPALLPYLAACVPGDYSRLLTIANLRGVRSVGLLFMVPMYLFVAALGSTSIVGRDQDLARRRAPASRWSYRPRTMHAAQTMAAFDVVALVARVRERLHGVDRRRGREQRGADLSRPPTVVLARRTLSLIVTALAFFLAGIALLCAQLRNHRHAAGRTRLREHPVAAVVGAVAGRGVVLLRHDGRDPRRARVVGEHELRRFSARVRACSPLENYLPPTFARRGRRLVYTSGILLLVLVSGALLLVFGGVTDRLIPLFAIGAFAAFTLSQIGHGRALASLRRQARDALARRSTRSAHARRSSTLAVIAVSKFAQGAWLTVVVIPALLLFFLRVRRARERIAREAAASGPLDLRDLEPPIIVIPIRRLDRVARTALRLGLSLSPGSVRRTGR